MTNKRYSDSPIEVGMVRYVGDGKGGVACHVIAELLPTERVWDEEYRMHVTTWPYTVRRATEAEEASYLTVDRAECHRVRY